MAGFVYIMSNPSFVRGRVKIGKSDRDPLTGRKSELETTGVPEPFRVEYFALVHDHHSLERDLHAQFAHCRINKAREFFDVDVAKVILEIRKRNFIREFLNYENPDNVHLRNSEVRLTSDLDAIDKKISELAENLEQKTRLETKSKRENFINQKIYAEGIDDIFIYTISFGFGWGLLIFCVWFMFFGAMNDIAALLSFVLAGIASYKWRKSVVDRRIAAISVEAETIYPLQSRDFLAAKSAPIQELKQRQRALKAALENTKRQIQEKNDL